MQFTHYWLKVQVNIIPNRLIQSSMIAKWVYYPISVFQLKYPNGSENIRVYHNPRVVRLCIERFLNRKLLPCCNIFKMQLTFANGLSLRWTFTATTWHWSPLVSLHFLIKPYPPDEITSLSRPVIIDTSNFWIFASTSEGEGDIVKVSWKRRGLHLYIWQRIGGAAAVS